MATVNKLNEKTATINIDINETELDMILNGLMRMRRVYENEKPPGTVSMARSKMYALLASQLRTGIIRFNER